MRLMKDLYPVWQISESVQNVNTTDNYVAMDNHWWIVIHCDVKKFEW